MGKAFIFLVSVLIFFISGAFGVFIYFQSGSDRYSLLWSIYAFGSFFIPGMFALYPGGKKKTNEWGDSV
jgi:hypothetical protein